MLRKRVEKEIEKFKKERKFLLISTVIIFLLFLAVSIASFNLQLKLNKIAEGQLKLHMEERTQKAVLSKEAITLKLPAVDKEGNGVIASLVVEAKEGSGKALVDIEGILFFTDTQESIITSREVASSLTGINLDNYDLTYILHAEADSIGGPSAGAALTIATIAALQDLPLRENVVITGRILPDGSIGEVSAIKQKAVAAKDVGATIFLVPPGEGTQNDIETKRVCEMEGETEICTIEKVQTQKPIGEDIGINVIEVRTIKEALDYFVLN